MYGKGGCAGWVVGGGGREGGRRRNQGRSECDSGLVGWWRDLAEEGNAANFEGLCDVMELRGGFRGPETGKIEGGVACRGGGGGRSCLLHFNIGVEMPQVVF